jgi:hypothetical protein
MGGFRKSMPLRFLYRASCRTPVIATLALFGLTLGLLNFCIAVVIEWINVLKSHSVTAAEGYLLGQSTSLMLLFPFFVCFAFFLHRQHLLFRSGLPVKARVLKTSRPLLFRLGPYQPRLRVDYEFDTADGKHIVASSVGTHREVFGNVDASETISILYLPWEPSICDLAIKIK